MTKDEALDLALEALQFDGFMPEDLTHRSLHAKAITAIKQARSAPVQEPVAWMYEDMMGLVGVRVQKEKPIVARPVTPLYTTSPEAQRTWVGLTDEEIQELRYKIDSTAHWTYDEFAKAIEAKLKEKNT